MPSPSKSGKSRGANIAAASNTATQEQTQRTLQTRSQKAGLQVRALVLHHCETWRRSPFFWSVKLDTCCGRSSTCAFHTFCTMFDVHSSLLVVSTVTSSNAHSTTCALVRRLLCTHLQSWSTSPRRYLSSPVRPSSPVFYSLRN